LFYTKLLKSFIFFFFFKLWFFFFFFFFLFRFLSSMAERLQQPYFVQNVGRVDKDATYINYP